MVAPRASRQNEIATRYASQVRSLPVTEAYGIFLNTQVPPFSSLAARQAMAFAVDRTKSLTSSFGGTVTCQILPPGMPGYRPYCPYTKDPTRAGVWTGPDLSRALRLVHASGTHGAKVTFWTQPRPLGIVIGNVAVKALDQLGYKVTLKVLPYDEYWEHVKTVANRSQAGFIGWRQDYAAPSEFVGELTCAALSEAPGDNENQAELCDHKLDRSFEAALAGQATDSPQASNSNWAGVDRMITGLSPWVPLFNPRNVLFVSRRVQNLQSNPQWGVLADQIWVH